MERSEFMMSTSAAIATLLLTGPTMLGRQATAGLAERIRVADEQFSVLGWPSSPAIVSHHDRVDEWFAFGADGNKFGVAGGQNQRVCLVA